MTAASLIRTPKLNQRRHEPELMDAPELQSEAHLLALKGLERINRWSRTARQFRVILEQWARNRPLRVLDLACGGGDVVLYLEDWFSRSCAGRIQFEGCDVSRRAVDHARKAARSRSSQVSFFRLDALTEKLPTNYDVLMNSLFIHHLSWNEAQRMFSRMADTTRFGILIGDLERCTAGYWLAVLGSRVLSRSPVVHIDAAISVRAAFSLSEFESLATEAGLSGYTLRRSWPFRLLFSWRRT